MEIRSIEWKLDRKDFAVLNILLVTMFVTLKILKSCCFFSTIFSKIFLFSVESVPRSTDCRLH